MRSFSMGVVCNVDAGLRGLSTALGLLIFTLAARNNHDGMNWPRIVPSPCPNFFSATKLKTDSHQTVTAFPDSGLPLNS